MVDNIEIKKENVTTQVDTGEQKKEFIESNSENSSPNDNAGNTGNTENTENH